MRSQLRTSFVDRITTVSDEGEVLSQTLKKHNYMTKDKDQFFLGYVRMLAVFNEISGPSIKVYAYLLMNYNAGTMIGINMAVKNDIKKFITSKAKGIGPIDNCLSELTKKGLLFKKQDMIGAYYINPRYAFKGSTKDRNNALKVIIELGCKNC